MLRWLTGTIACPRWAMLTFNAITLLFLAQNLVKLFA